MTDEIFTPGDTAFAASDSPSGSYSVFFEDEGETGYFYALDRAWTDDPILDALHIYNVADVVDKDRPSALRILWSSDGMRCALLINGYAHAAFDFKARRGYCRNNFPNFPTSDTSRWKCDDHSWSDAAINWLK